MLVFARLNVPSSVYLILQWLFRVQFLSEFCKSLVLICEFVASRESCSTVAASLLVRCFEIPFCLRVCCESCSRFVPEFC